MYILKFFSINVCLFKIPRGFPLWILMLNPFSHLLLVINCSMNIIFYGLFNKKFIEVAKNRLCACFPELENWLKASSSAATAAGSAAPKKGNQVPRISVATTNGSKPISPETKVLIISPSSNIEWDQMQQQVSYKAMTSFCVYALDLNCKAHYNIWFYMWSL